MALRFMQIFVPEKTDVNFTTFLEGYDIIGTWRDSTVEDRIVLHLLLPAEETEPIMDKFEKTFSGLQGFRVILFPVEAVLPRPKIDEEPPPTPVESAKDEKELKRISREELYNDIAETLGVNRVFVAMTILSSVVAAVGLIRNDVAIIIGAMVIAPLLGPNVAMSLAATLGDFALLKRAIVTNLIGVVLALGFSILLGGFLFVDSTIPALSARTHLGLSDLALALAAGSAGTFAFTRGFAGAVIGVMVAVALMPPLVTLGMLIGSAQFVLALGAFLLVAANVVCINLAGVATFLAQGVRPRTWWEEERAKKSANTAIAIWCSLLVLLGVIIYLTQFAGVGPT